MFHHGPHLTYITNIALSLQPYMWGVALAYTAIAYCYFCIAFGGYWAFGNGVASNVMLSVGRPSWLVGVANLLVVIHVFGSYQVSFVPMLQLILLSCAMLCINWFVIMCFCLLHLQCCAMLCLSCFLCYAYACCSLFERCSVPCFSWVAKLCCPSCS